MKKGQNSASQRAGLIILGATDRSLKQSIRCVCETSLLSQTLTLSLISINSHLCWHRGCIVSDQEEIRLVRRTFVAYVILAAVSAGLLSLTKKVFLVMCRPVKLLPSYNVVDVESIYLLGKQFTLHVGLQTSNRI
eukprot:jgi/Botrbrau1/7868/Bobra.9_2s0044.1